MIRGKSKCKLRFYQDLRHPTAKKAPLCRFNQAGAPPGVGYARWRDRFSWWLPAPPASHRRETGYRPALFDCNRQGKINPTNSLPLSTAANGVRSLSGAVGSAHFSDGKR
jgi:hypothetical protein